MAGKLDATRQYLASELVAGAKAEIVGGRSLRGISPQYAEVDGVPVELPLPPIKEATAIQVTRPDGAVLLFVERTNERARELLRQAKLEARVV